VKVLIIDGQQLFAEGIVLALSGREFEVLPLATTAAEGIHLALQDCPDLILMDVRLRDGSGIDTGARILERCRKTKVVALTDVKDPEVLSEAIRRGFHGYLTKDSSLDYFLEAIKLVLDGGIVIPEGLAAAAAGATSPDERQAQLLKELLTDRELKVLQLLAQGVSSPTLARELSVSRNTVRTYVHNILTKFQVHSRLEAVALAVRHHLVEPPNNDG
jgi:two-component system nitrate/nitrite response regulator NarL